MKKELDKKKEIINKYNSTSHFYDKRYSEIQKLKYTLILKENKIEDQKFLDVGCGTGILYEFLKDSDIVKGIHAHIAIDISLKMLKDFADKFKEKTEGQVVNNVSLIMADMENLPIRENIFDLMFSITSLQNLPSYQDGITEMIRIAKKDITLNISILNKNLEKKKFKDFLESKFQEIKIIDECLTEDIIFQCKTKKKS